MASEGALLSKIDSTVGRINSKTTELQNSINSTLSASWLGIPEWVKDKVRDGWNTFARFLKDLWDTLAEILTNMGSPSKLFSTGDSWSNSVGGPVSQQVQHAEAGSLAVDDNWDGTAATAYKQALPLQKTALEKIKSTFTDGISQALSDVAKAIYVFWGALIVALGALVAGIIAAIASTATILGLPAGPFIAAAAVLAAIAACTAGGLNLKSAASAANSSLRQKINDNVGYRDGHWPKATTS